MLRLITLLSLILALLVCACQSGEPQEGQRGRGRGGARGGDASTNGAEPAPQPVPVEVEVLKRGPISETLLATGTLVSLRQVIVVGDASGPPVALPRDVGHRVEEGQVIGELTNPQLALNVETARHRLRRAEAERARLAPLLDKGFIPRAQFDSAEAEVQIARDELSLTRASVDALRVRAPFSGVVSSRDAEPGAVISPGQPLVSLIDPDALALYLKIPEHELGRLSEGLPIEVSSEALGPPPFPAHLERIAPTVDPTSGTIEVTAVLDTVDRPSGARLRPGMFVQARVITARRDDVLLLPKRALLFEERQPFVFIINDGVAQRVEVATGASSQSHVEVTRGLEAGQQVVVLGQSGLRDKAPVVVVRRDGVRVTPDGAPAADEAAPADDGAPADGAAPADEAAPADDGAPADGAAPADDAAPAADDAATGSGAGTRSGQ